MPRKCSGVNCPEGGPCKNKKTGLKWKFNPSGGFPAYLTSCGDFRATVYLYEYNIPTKGHQWAILIEEGVNKINWSRKKLPLAQATVERFFNKKVDKMLRDLGRKS